MERLRGVKITEAPQYGHPMDQIAQETVRMLFKQCFEDGFFHGDLHPGNLLILEDSRIGLIDFGLVGRLSPSMRETMADLLLHVTTKNNEGVALHCMKLAFIRVKLIITNGKQMLLNSWNNISLVVH